MTDFETPSCLLQQFEEISRRNKKSSLSICAAKKIVYDFDWRKKFFVCFNDLKRSEGDLKKSSCRAPTDQNKNLAFRHDLFFSSTPLVLLHLTLNLVSFSALRLVCEEKETSMLEKKTERDWRRAKIFLHLLSISVLSVPSRFKHSQKIIYLTAETLINWRKLSLDGTARVGKW